MSAKRPTGKRLGLEQLEDRLAPANDLFTVPPPALAGTPVQLRFEWGGGGAAFKNEIGVYAVDDAAGRVNGLLPSDAGYAAAALSRAAVVFASGAGKGAKNALAFNGGQQLGLYLVSNDTTAAAVAGRANVFFTFDGANVDRFDHVLGRLRADGGTDFRFEDMLGGGDRDFNDAVISVTATRAISVPGAVGQTTPTNFVKRPGGAAYRNEIGAVKVDGPDGRIGGLRPGDQGYARAALLNGSRQVIFSDAALPGVNARTLDLESGQQYVFYVVTQGTAEELLARNPGNAFGGGPLAYFSFSEANPDGLEHFAYRGPGEFGFEDLFGLGDQDFDDLDVSFGFGTPTGAVAPPPVTPPTPPVTPPTPPTPPTPDTTAPTAAFALTNDTGVSATDRITSNPEIQSTFTDASPITTLRAGFSNDTNTFVNVLPSLGADNRLTFTAALLQQINGGVALPNGPRTLFVQAGDSANNTGLLQFAFTLDTLAPAAVRFELDDATDSGNADDLRTDRGTVTLVGTAEANTRVQLSRTTVPSTPGSGAVLATANVAANGTFTFTGVTLNDGPNSFVVRAIDTAGNVGATFAQTITKNLVPTTISIPDQAGVAGGATVDVALTNFFDDAETIVRFTTNVTSVNGGVIDLQLFDDAGQTPITAANFLSYVDRANANQDYDGSIFHRVRDTPGLSFVQGGGFNFNAAGSGLTGKFPTFENANTFPQIVNEPEVSNTRGTISMAKGGSPNSATSQFFFNTGDNSVNLDLASNSGGFTAFGQVLDGGLDVLDDISELNRQVGVGAAPGDPAAFPVQAGADVTNFPANIDSLDDLAAILTAVNLGELDRIAFTVVNNSNAAVATAAIANGTLTFTPLTAGTTTVTVRATDLDGSFVENTVRIVVA